MGMTTGKNQTATESSQTKDMSKRKHGPSLRIAGGFKRVSDLADKLSAAIHEIEDMIDEDKEHTSALFEVEKGKPVVEVVGPDGVLSTEAGSQSRRHWRAFTEAVDWISEQDIREIEIWAEAFDKAAKKLRSDLRRIRRNPKKY